MSLDHLFACKGTGGGQAPRIDGGGEGEGFSFGYGEGYGYGASFGDGHGRGGNTQNLGYGSGDGHGKGSGKGDGEGFGFGDGFGCGVNEPGNEHNPWDLAEQLCLAEDETQIPAALRSLTNDPSAGPVLRDYALQHNLRTLALSLKG